MLIDVFFDKSEKYRLFIVRSYKKLLTMQGCKLAR